MRAIVISDTHIPVASNEIPDGLIKELENAELIIHAGDFVEISVLNMLKKFAPTEAVIGNMDYPEVRKILPEKKVLQLGGFKIGLTHGYGAPQNILGYVQNKFENEKLDCIIYGHSHTPSIETIENVIYFNPGSPTDHVYAPYNAFGILEIKNNKILPQIIRL